MEDAEVILWTYLEFAKRPLLSNRTNNG